MIQGLLGRKVGMLQLFDNEGRHRGVTVIEAGPCLVTQVKTEETDGYAAVQLGFGAAKRRNKPARGHLGRRGDLRYLREFRADDSSEHTVGDRVGVEIFQEGDHIDVTSVSKGRGFAGTVKRHHFAGGPKTHGQSDRHRAPGSIGSGNTPGRVFKGIRMSGHMGDKRVTVKNLEVLQSNPARAILMIAGTVPGARGALVKIRYSSRTLEIARNRKPQAIEEETPQAVEGDAPAAEERSADEAAQQPSKEETPDGGAGSGAEETEDDKS